jgi:hypothetical protein
MAEVKPWSPRRVTETVQRQAHEDGFELSYTLHARSQMALRDLIVGDVLHVLRHGHVYDEGRPATRAGLFKYCMESGTPNSGVRTVRVVLIPSTDARKAKVITVMWADEPGQGSWSDGR